MTTINAFSDAFTASVELVITKTASVSKITRTDVNGTAEVRSMAFQLPSVGTGKLILNDYEPANGESIYRVYHAGSEAVAATSTVTLALAQPWVYVPVLPEFSVRVDQVTTFQSSRTSSSVAHTVIGRQDPVVNLGKLSLRAGQIDLWAGDYLTTKALDAAVNTGEILMIRQTVPGMDMYVTVSDVDVQPYAEEADATKWRYTLRFQEVERPDAALAGARGWTFQEVANSYSTFGHVAATYATFADLVRGI